MAEDTKQENKKTLKENGVFLLFDSFNSKVSKEIVNWILEANFSNYEIYDHLTLIINSPGGAVNDAFAIIDCMKSSKIPVHTIGLGEICSCGLLTFIAGEKGHRILTPNTSILSHQYSWGSHGKEFELFARVKEFNLSTKRMLDHYQLYTGMTIEQIREKLLPPHDVWLSAEEALEYNICDEIKLI